MSFRSGQPNSATNQSPAPPGLGLTARALPDYLFSLSQNPSPDPMPDDSKRQPEGEPHPDGRPGDDPGSTPPPPPKPIPLPRPDGFGDINRASNLTKAQEKAEAKAKKRRKKARLHPKDAYEPLKQKRSCGGALFVLLLLVVGLPLGGAALWINHWKTEFTGNRGHAWVTLREEHLRVAPTEKTAYLGARVLYEAPETREEVAFLGGTWWLSGTFHEPVSFRGFQLTVEPGARFLKGLDVQAAKYIDNGAEINGELTGRILQQEVGP